MRELNLQEEKLLEELISRSNIKIPSNWKNDLLVSPLHDGKMGSLTLFPHNTLNKERHFGVQVSECQFKDIDGVPVIASLYLDKDNELFELDIWKVDFSKLEMIPSHFEDVEYSNQIPKIKREVGGFDKRHSLLMNFYSQLLI